MTTRRVRVAESFFDRLDDLLPAERPGDGRPSAADFLALDIARVVDLLADDYEGSTMPFGTQPDIRVLVASGALVTAFAVYVRLTEDGSVDVIYLDID